MPAWRRQPVLSPSAAGLSPLHNVTRVIRMEQIPVLGTGKTDYRALRDSLRKE